MHIRAIYTQSALRALKIGFAFTLYIYRVELKIEYSIYKGLKIRPLLLKIKPGISSKNKGHSF